jgi:hypothetical protein
MLLQFKYVIPLTNNESCCDKNLFEPSRLLDAVAVWKIKKYARKNEARDL